MDPAGQNEVLLRHNDAYPVEHSRLALELWKTTLKDGNLRSLIDGVEKRLMLEDFFVEAGDRRFRAKFYRTIGPRRKLTALFTKPESVRNFDVSDCVEKAGIPTHRPLCVWGECRYGLHEWSLLFTEDLGPLPDLPDFLKTVDRTDRDSKVHVLTHLARALAKLHDAGVYVHDPAKNILVGGEKDDLKFYFIDFDTVLPYRPLTVKRIAKVLRHCIHPPGDLEMFRRDERVAFLEEYLKARGRENWFDAIFPNI